MQINGMSLIIPNFLYKLKFNNKKSIKPLQILYYTSSQNDILFLNIIIKLIIVLLCESLEWTKGAGKEKV